MSGLPRLLIVAHSAELYGADRCLHAAIPALVEHYAVTVAVPAQGPGIDVIRQLGATVVALPDYALRRRHLTVRGVLPWIARVGSSVRALGRLHRAQPFCAVYSNTLAACLGPILRRRWKVPHVVHVHECPTEPAWLPRVLLAPIKRHADAVICNSQFTADWVVGRRPALRDCTTVVYNGLVLMPAPAGPPSPSDCFRVSCVARIHPKKGHMVLFEALRLATEAGRGWELHLFGDTLPEHQAIRADLEAYARSQRLTDMIHWHGFVDDVRAQYAGADVAVVPSVQPEEFSLACLEAQSLMLPVVATGPGGASEVLSDRETGFIVPPGDPAALYGALCRLADDPALRATMGRAGRARVEAKFGSEAFADGVCTVIARAVDAPRLVRQP